MAVTSLVLGIIALVIDLASVGSFGWLGAIIGVIGLVFGILGRKDPQKKGMATAGLVCSIIGIVLGLILYVACVACLTAADL